MFCHSDDSKQCSLLKSTGSQFLLKDKNLIILSVNRDDYNLKMVYLRLENMSEVEQSVITKRELEFEIFNEFLDKIRRIEVVNLAGVSRGETGSDQKSDTEFIVEPSDIITLRIEF